VPSNRECLEKSSVSSGRVSRGSEAERVKRWTATCWTRCSLRYVGTPDVQVFHVSTAILYSAPVTSEAGEEVAWHQTNDLLQVPHKLRCSVLAATRAPYSRVLSSLIPHCSVWSVVIVCLLIISLHWSMTTDSILRLYFLYYKWGILEVGDSTDNKSNPIRFDPLAPTSWQKSKWRGGQMPTLNFRLSKNYKQYPLVRKCLFKMQTLGCKNLCFRKIQKQN